VVEGALEINAGGRPTVVKGALAVEGTFVVGQHNPKDVLAELGRCAADNSALGDKVDELDAAVRTAAEENTKLKADICKIAQAAGVEVLGC